MGPLPILVGAEGLVRGAQVLAVIVIGSILVWGLVVLIAAVVEGLHE